MDWDRMVAQAEAEQNLKYEIHVQEVKATLEMCHKLSKLVRKCIPCDSYLCEHVGEHNRKQPNFGLLLKKLNHRR